MPVTKPTSPSHPHPHPSSKDGHRASSTGGLTSSHPHPHPSTIPSASVTSRTYSITSRGLASSAGSGSGTAPPPHIISSITSRRPPLTNDNNTNIPIGKTMKTMGNTNGTGGATGTGTTTGANTARGDKNKNNFSKSGPVSSSKLGSSSVMSSTLDVDSDDDAISEQQREIEREAKRQLQAKLKKEQESGPPPDMNKRQLIFDSMSKIISRSFGKGSSRSAILGETRGTYVYTWGAGYHGQLGRRFERGKKKYATIPKMVPIDIAVRQVACGGLHTAAVTDAGTVYTWGDARAHQLGYQPHGFTNQPTPHLVESLEGHVFITQVACGQSHTVALSDKGNLISWGLSKFGQGGHNDRQVIKAPRKIRIDDPTIKFVDVSCGDKHTVALTSKGVVYSFGCAQQGQLGHDESPPVDKLKPTLVEGLRHVNVTSVVCGAIHTCVVTDQGAVYTFGFGEHFYPNEDQNFFYKPVRIPFADRVVQVACGQSHIIALNDRGDVYTWGSGSYGQLGHGVKGNLNVPRLVLTGKSIAQVAAGRYHSVALTSFGAMYAWGCGENGQLGHHTDDNVLFPKVIEPAIGTVVGQIACGEHHTAVLTSTPWLKVSDEIAEWLHSEREEYALKVKYLKKTNHGLVKKDLLKIQERMDELHTAWAQEKRDRQHDELEEQARDIQSVKQRETLMTEIAKQTQEQEQKQNYVVGPSDLSGSPNEWKERDDDRPDSASHTINNGALIQDIRKRRTKGMGMSSILPRVNGAPATAPSSSQSTTDSRGPSRTGIMTARAASPEEHTETRALPALQLGSQTERRMVIPPPENRQAGVARSTFLKESSQMVRRMKQIIADTGDSSNESRLKKMITLVFGFRKDYDTLRSITTQKIKELEGIQRKVEALKKNNDSTKHRKKINAQTLKALKMKLSTVTIKITETEENRKNYALNIAHLKEEELERYYQLEALRKQCAENDAFARKINDIKLQSLEDKDRAEQELLAFQQEIHQFQGFIGDQLGKFHSISTLAKVRKEKREAEKLARTKKVHDRISQRINKLNEEMEEKNKEGLAMAQQLESVNERLRYFEKRFQQVASATGLTNPDEIINKFTLKEEIKHELNIEIQQKHNQIQQQTAKIAELQSELQYAKDNFVDSKWKDVDSLEEGVRDSDAKSEKNKSESERITQRLAYFREGLVSLISMLPDEILSNGTTEIDKPKVMADGNMEHTTDILALLDGKLDVLVHACEEGEMSRRQKEFEAAQEKREREAAAAARLAAEAAEKIKMTTLYNLTRRVSNDPHLMLSGPSSTTPHDGDGDGDDAASGPSSRDSSTHASRTDLLDGNKDELARTVQRDAVYNQAAAQRQEDGTAQQQVAAF